MAPRPRHPTPPAAVPANGASPAGGEGREVEWQLTAPDLGLVRRWLEQHALFEDLRIEPRPMQQLRDTYLDTEDWRIFRAGFALRLRDKGGGQVEATLKGLRSARDDLADRREITESLPGRDDRALADATGPVGSRVHDIAGVKPLRILFEVRTSRHRFAVRSRRPAADLGEIALDEARFSRGNRRHRGPMILTRVELESIGPDPAPLERLASRLRSECGLHPAKENKFAVGLRSASLEPPRGSAAGAEHEGAAAVMDPGTRAGDFAAAALRRLLQEWHANEPTARLGESAEPLHRLRVTTRRIDTVLSLFRAYLPAALRKSDSKLKGLLDALGAVRDIDIRLEATSSFRSGLPEVERPALDPLLRHLESERAHARSAMLRALDAKPTRHWLDTLPDLLARPAASTSSASPRSALALAVVPGLIRERYRKLRKSARRLTPESSLTEFHQVRIRTKKLRYALEVVAPTYAKAARRMLARLNKLQSKLGTQHDGDVAARFLTQLANDPPTGFTAATLFMMGRMAQLHAAQAASMGRKIERPWRRVRGRRWKSLRSRMELLRDEARERNESINGLQHGSRGNGRLAGTGVNGSLSGPAATWAFLGTGVH